MRILFIGNTNNYPFMLALAAKKMGHHVQVVLDHPDHLHQPWFRYKSIELDSWVHDGSSRISRFTPTLPKSYIKSIIPDFKDFDFVVANGLGIASAYSLKLPVFSLLTGTDITYYASFRSLKLIYKSYSKNLFLLKKLFGILMAVFTIVKQRKMIKKSFSFSHFAKGVVPSADIIFADLGLNQNQHHSFIISDTLNVKYSDLLRTQIQSPLLIMNIARLNWQIKDNVNIDTLDMKGTDILIYGFARFLKASSSKSKLMLFRKGININETEKLVKDLNLVDSVIWHDQVTQADIIQLYKKSDVVVDQLSTSFIGMGGLDAMASGRPLIANTRADAWTPSYNFEGSPILSAITSDDVANHLQNLYQDLQLHHQLSKASRQYVENFKSSEFAMKSILASYSSFLG